MIKALFFDFYGTIVHEDGEVIKKITQIIYETGNAKNKSDIDAFWWKDFQQLFTNAFGDTFETQRTLEKKSLEHTLEKFNSTANVEKLSNYMFEHWIKPPIFDDAKELFEKCSLPIYIVSNIDRKDILQALDFHNLKPVDIFTSEDAKSYKPRKELFELALKKSELKVDEVIHIGDSVSSDIKGAASVGMNAILINRFNKKDPNDIQSISSLLDVLKSIKKI